MLVDAAFKGETYFLATKEEMEMFIGILIVAYLDSFLYLLYALKKVISDETGYRGIRFEKHM